MISSLRDLKPRLLGHNICLVGSLFQGSYTSIFITYVDFITTRQTDCSVVAITLPLTLSFRDFRQTKLLEKTTEISDFISIRVTNIKIRPKTNMVECVKNTTGNKKCKQRVTNLASASDLLQWKQVSSQQSGSQRPGIGAE
jgi:hypothetical protein